MGGQGGGWKIPKSGQHPEHLGMVPHLVQKYFKNNEKRLKIGRRGSVRAETLGN